MRIPSGVTDQVIYFVAVDGTDLITRKTGLSSFTVYRSRNGGSATAFTTPTVTEVSSSNMPGVYKILLDEDMSIDAGDDSQEMCLHISATSMAPVTRTFELYRPKVTAGETLTVSSGAVGSVSGLTASNLDATISSRASAANLTTLTGYVDTEVASIKGVNRQARHDVRAGDRLAWRVPLQRRCAGARAGGHRRRQRADCGRDRRCGLGRGPVGPRWCRQRRRGADSGREFRRPVVDTAARRLRLRHRRQAHRRQHQRHDQFARHADQRRCGRRLHRHGGRRHQGEDRSDPGRRRPRWATSRPRSRTPTRCSSAIGLRSPARPPCDRC
jgi:hypothetical protein